MNSGGISVPVAFPSTVTTTEAARAEKMVAAKKGKRRRWILIFIFQPEQRLGDGDVAPHFFIGNFGSQFFPQTDPIWIAQRQSGQQQGGLAARPVVPGL